MKKILLCLSLFVLAMPAFAADPVTEKPPNSCPQNPHDPKCIRPLAEYDSPTTNGCGSSHPTGGICCRRVYNPDCEDGLGCYDIVCSSAASPDAFAVAQGKKVYRCYVDGYDPPVCVEIPVQNGSRTSPADLANANNAALQYAQQRAVGADEPVLNCANAKGHSACCRKVIDVGDGSIIILCEV